MAQDYLHVTFDGESREVVSVFDEAPLWSAVFGALLLKHVPLAGQSMILDLGCGTGFPTLELAGRAGPAATVWGVDVWRMAIERAREKARVQGVPNVHFGDNDAASLPFADATFDLVTANLGVNNFADPAKALAEARRVLKPGGRVALTTNLRGHMAEFYTVFEAVLREHGAPDEVAALRQHVAHRYTVPDLDALLSAQGFEASKVELEPYVMRFANGTALLSHYFVKIGFLDAWKAVIQTSAKTDIFAQLESALNAQSLLAGGLTLTVPMAYLEARVPAG